MSGKSKTPAKIGTAIKKAILELGPKQCSFKEMRKYLLSKYPDNSDMTDTTSIKQYLKNAVDKGALLKLDDGNYEVKETARRRRSRSRSRSRGKSRRRSTSRKRSGRKRSRSGSRKRRRSSSKGRKRSSSKRRKRSSSGERNKRSSSGKQRKTRRKKSKEPPENVE